MRAIGGHTSHGGLLRVPQAIIVGRDLRTNHVPGCRWHRLECVECGEDVTTYVPPDPDQWPLHRCRGERGRPARFTSAVECSRPQRVDTRPGDEHL